MIYWSKCHCISLDIWLVLGQSLSIPFTGRQLLHLDSSSGVAPLVPEPVTDFLLRSLPLLGPPLPGPSFVVHTSKVAYQELVVIPHHASLSLQLPSTNLSSGQNWYPLSKLYLKMPLLRLLWRLIVKIRSIRQDSTLGGTEQLLLFMKGNTETVYIWPGRSLVLVLCQ